MVDYCMNNQITTILHGTLSYLLLLNKLNYRKEFSFACLNKFSHPYLVTQDTVSIHYWVASASPTKSRDSISHANGTGIDVSTGIDLSGQHRWKHRADSRSHPMAETEWVRVSQREERSTINHSILNALNESKLNNSNRYTHNLNIIQLTGFLLWRQYWRHFWGSFFYGGISPSKIGLIAPYWEPVQALSKARVFLSG
jgi:hypothetical protein